MLSDAELRSVGVPAAKVEKFRALLDNAARGWQRPKRTAPRRGDVTQHLDQLIAALEPLRDEGAGETAFGLWQIGMAGDCNLSIDEMIEAAEHAKVRADELLQGKGGPRRTVAAAPGFDEFLQNMLMAAKVCGFEFKAYKNADQTPGGNLPQLLDLLTPHLPRGLHVPVSPATLLGSIERARQKFHPK